MSRYSAKLAVAWMQAAIQILQFSFALNTNLNASDSKDHWRSVGRGAALSRTGSMAQTSLIRLI